MTSKGVPARRTICGDKISWIQEISIVRSILVEVVSLRDTTRPDHAAADISDEEAAGLLRIVDPGKVSKLVTYLDGQNQLGRRLVGKGIDRHGISKIKAYSSFWQSKQKPPGWPGGR